MRPSLRFLVLATVGWAGIRAGSLGALPGAELFTIEASEAKPPPIAPTEFPQIEPLETAYAEMPPSPWGTDAGWQQPIQPVVTPVYYRTGPLSAPVQQAAYTSLAPTPAPLFYPPIPTLDEWPLSRIAATSMPPMRAASPTVPQSRPIVAAAPALDRVQLTSWALLRGQPGSMLGPSSLGTGGNLGGSQAGARLTYNFTRQIAATLRTTTDVGRGNGEVAAGVRVQPLQSMPVWFTLERRQALSRFAGRSAFALFVEGGVWQRPLPFQFDLDAYLQAGAVGFRDRDLFIDGGLAASRPVYRQFSAGFGVWGGAQPGVYRVDAGPRVSMSVRPNVKVHLDWRHRLAGNAQPGSGPALTLAGDF